MFRRRSTELAGVLISRRLAYRVEIKDLHAKAEVVLVVYPLEFVVEQSGPVVDTVTTPWIEGSSLELSFSA